MSKNDTQPLSDSELLDFICRMKRKARRAQNGRVRRVAYSENDRQQTIKMLEAVEARDGSSGVKIVCEMLSLNESTLMGWLEKYTDPQGDWHLRDVALRMIAKINTPFDEKRPN